MKISRSVVSKSVSTLLIALILGACGGDSPESLIASSKDYLAKNDSKAAVIQLKNALQQNPNLAEARFLLGTALLDGGDITGAELELRKALELKYSPDAVVPLLANVMLAKGQAKKLIDDFGGVTLSPGEPLAALNTTLSVAYASLGRLDIAKQRLDAALATKPDYAPAQLADIRQRLAARDVASARSKIDALLSQNPANPDGLIVERRGLLASEGDLDGALVQYKKAIDAKPTHIAAYAAAISLLIKTNKPEAAKTHLDALKKIAPKNAQSYFLDAQLNYHLKDFKAARESAQQLLRIAPNHPDGLQVAGAIEYQLRSYLQAETYLAKALQLSPQLPLARRLLVASQLRAGNAAKAIETLQPAMDRIDQDPALLSLAGEAYLQHGEPNKAAEYFAKASKLEPNSVAKKTSLALAHIAQGSTDSAYQELERISLSDKGVTADLALIAAYLQSNQVEKALKAIDGLEKKQPDNPASHNLRARALLAKKDLPGAKSSFEKALAINPTFFPAVSGLASLDILDKKPELARKRFESVLSVDPKNTQALLAIAELRAADGSPVEEVASLIGKAVTANPTETTPRLALIQYLLKNKDYKKALSAAIEANTVIPDKPEILDALGRAQQLSGELNQASITYGKLVALQPASPLPLLRLAETQFANKNPEEGTKSAEKSP
jgi:putative PEP-CTERM system TPR-repeat lipoprotein